VRVEQEARPVWSRERARDQVGDRDRALRHQRLVLRGQRSLGVEIGLAVHHDTETTYGDAWLYHDAKIERRRSDLLEPEAQLLDEVEREPVAPGRTGCDHDNLELGYLTRLDHSC
jgi:hypothetical protein